MSNVKIRAALENHLKTLPDIPVVIWENSNIKPSEDNPEIEEFVKFAEPSDMGVAGYMQRGYMQLNLLYPANAGPNPAETMGEKLRAHYALGTSLVKDDVTVNTDRTSEVSGGTIENGDYVVRVFIQFHAHIID